MDLYFYLILGIATAFGAAFVISIRGIYYSSPDTDNELMAYAAAQSHKWHWLSDVHKYSVSSVKVAMKEWTIILLSIFQKILRDKTTNRPYTVMTGLAVSVSTVLIYLIASSYFNQTVGLIVAVLYIVSFWPWQVSLYGGHANIANLFFLLSAYSIQLAASATSVPSFILIAAGGAFLGFSLFSSPSAYKYFIAVFAALFFSTYRGFFASNDIIALKNTLPINHLLLLDGIIAATFLFACILILVTYKSVVKKMYYRATPGFLHKMISARDRFPLEHYIAHANKEVKMLIRWSFWILFSLLILFNLIPASVISVFAVGFILVFFMITLPNVKENVIGYFTCMLVHKRRSHFKYHVNDFAKIGIAVHRTMRGAGLSWVPKMLWTFAPFHAALFVAVFIWGQYESISAGNMHESVWLVVIAFIALSPIIWAEITRAPQVSRTYSPCLVTGLLFPAYVISDMSATYALIIFSGFGILAFGWNLWKFTNDIYPARMTVRNLARIVRRLGINDIYTYQTALNDLFVCAIPGIGQSQYLPKREVIPPFRVHYIQRLDEVKEDWIAIPGTNHMTAVLGKNKRDDYANDPIRNRLVETRQMEKIAAVKLKTYSTSTILVHEDEVASYCAFYLKRGANDLYRGYAWLVHSSKLKIKN